MKKKLGLLQWVYLSCSFCGHLSNGYFCVHSVVESVLSVIIDVLLMSSGLLV